MNCLICGKRLKAVLTHVRVVHYMTSDEYRLKFDIPLTMPLIDEDVSQKISESTRDYLYNKGGIDNLLEIGKAFRKKGVKKNRRELPACTKEFFRNCSKKNVVKAYAKNRENRLKLLQETEFIKDYDAGMSYDSLCKKYGICKSTINNYRKELLLKDRKASKKTSIKQLKDRHKIDKDRKIEFIKSSGMRKDHFLGMMQIDMSRKYGVPSTTINGWIKKGYFRVDQ